MAAVFREKSKPKDTLEWVLYDKDGNVKERSQKIDLILTDGREIFADRIGDTAGQAHLQAVAIGTNNTAPDVSQTDLQGSELFRKATTNSQPVSGTERFTVTFVAGEGTGTIEEAVLADALAPSGSRKCATRVLTGTIAKGAGDILTVTFEINFPA